MHLTRSDAASVRVRVVPVGWDLVRLFSARSLSSEGTCGGLHPDVRGRLSDELDREPAATSRVLSWITWYVDELEQMGLAGSKDCSVQQSVEETPAVSTAKHVGLSCGLLAQFFMPAKQNFSGLVKFRFVYKQ